MMAFKTPSPQALFVGAAENSQEVELRISARMCPFPIFQHIERILTPHHGRGGNKTGAN